MTASLLLTLLVFVASCATSTPYKEAGARGEGYKTHKLDDTKFRVSFRGNRLTERDQVETYLIYRAAEVTLKEGFTHFVMNNLSTDRKTEYEAASPAIYGYYMPNAGTFPYYVYGNPNAPRSGTLEDTEYEAVAYVSMVKAPPQAIAASYFKADEVIKNLEPHIKRP